MHDFTLMYNLSCSYDLDKIKQELSDGGSLLDAFANGSKLLLTFFISICNETISKGFTNFSVLQHENLPKTFPSISTLKLI